MRIPKRAEEIDRIEGVLPTGAFKGEHLRMRRFRIPERYADGGTEIIRIWVEESQIMQTQTYSGRNLSGAAAEMDEMRAALRKSGQTV